MNSVSIVSTNIQIYRILVNQDHYYQGRNQAAVTPPAFGPALKEHFPEVQHICRIDDSRGFVKTENRSFYENGLGFVDPEFLTIFNFPLILGDKNSVLTDPFSLVISEEMALKYFGDNNPLGRTIIKDDKYNYCQVILVMSYNNLYITPSYKRWSCHEKIQSNFDK